MEKQEIFQPTEISAIVCKRGKNDQNFASPHLGLYQSYLLSSHLLHRYYADQLPEQQAFNDVILNKRFHLIFHQTFISVSKIVREHIQNIRKFQKIVFHLYNSLLKSVNRRYFFQNDWGKMSTANDDCSIIDCFFYCN